VPGGGAGEAATADAQEEKDAEAFSRLDTEKRTMNDLLQDAWKASEVRASSRQSPLTTLSPLPLPPPSPHSPHPLSPPLPTSPPTHPGRAPLAAWKTSKSTPTSHLTGTYPLPSAGNNQKEKTKD